MEKCWGATSGFKRTSEDFYQARDQPKQLYARELSKHAACKLQERQLPQALKIYERKIQLSCQMPSEQVRSFWQTVHEEVP